MQNRYNNVRNWLLSNERYEDIVRFDKSDQAKERFYCEMNGIQFKEAAKPKGRINYDSLKLEDCNDVEILKGRVETLLTCLKIKDDIIKLLNMRLNY